MITKTPNHTVETWYDRRSRNWVTQIKDAEGDQVGDALFAGNRVSAKSNHATAIRLASRH